MHSVTDEEIDAAKAERGEQVYRVQRGCWSCLHRFEYNDYDEGTRLYCNRAGDRPKPCGSVAMGEGFFWDGTGPEARDVPDDAVDTRMAAWNDWAGKHGVREAGLCNLYKHDINIKNTEEG